MSRQFFTDLNDLLERLATFSSLLVLLGDFNIHVDDISDSHGAELLNVFASHELTTYRVRVLVS